MKQQINYLWVSVICILGLGACLVLAGRLETAENKLAMVEQKLYVESQMNAQLKAALEVPQKPVYLVPTYDNDLNPYN